MDFDAGLHATPPKPGSRRARRMAERAEAAAAPRKFPKLYHLAGAAFVVALAAGATIGLTLILSGTAPPEISVAAVVRALVTLCMGLFVAYLGFFVLAIIASTVLQRLRARPNTRRRQRGRFGAAHAYSAPAASLQRPAPVQQEGTK